MHRLLTALLPPFVLSLPLRAADWPQFLGPNRDGSSPEMIVATALLAAAGCAKADAAAVPRGEASDVVCAAAEIEAYLHSILLGSAVALERSAG